MEKRLDVGYQQIMRLSEEERLEYRCYLPLICGDNCGSKIPLVHAKGKLIDVCYIKYADSLEGKTDD